MIRASSELMLKELRLQKTNAMFTVAVIILGIAALLTLRATGTEIGSFSVKDITTGLFLAVLLPVLILILPLMIGSTAAAAEKSMGVGAWQSALPVHRRQILAIKVVVTGAGCAIVSGALPYVLQHWAQLDGGDRLVGLFRNTWTGWVGLLCGTIGFYGGALARDDYQGLLIGVLPLGAVGLMMWLADPALLVFPAFGTEAFWKEWALVVRLGIIATAFVFFSAGLLRYSGQFRWRQVGSHALVLAVLIFSLTLWNVVTERTLLTKPRPATVPAEGQWPPELYSRLALKGSLADIAIKSDPDYFVDMNLHQLGPNETRDLNFGTLSRRSHAGNSSTREKSHWFAVLQDHTVREFPQAVTYEVLGWTENGRWLWTGEKAGVQTISGPLGFAVSSAFLPDGWFHRLRSLLRFAPISAPLYPSYANRETIAESEDSSVLQSALPGRRIVWKDIRAAVPENKRAAIKLSDVLTNVATASYTADNGATVTAILRPDSDKGIFTLAGWTIGEVLEVTDDNKWALRRNHPPETYSELYLPAEVMQVSSTVTTDGAGLKMWEIPRVRSMDDGTTLVLYGFRGQLPVRKLGGREYLLYHYRKTGSVEFGNRVVESAFPVESGVLFFDLETGRETMFNMAPPWPVNASLILQGILSGQDVPGYNFPSPTGDINHLGDLYLVQGNALMVQSSTVYLLTHPNPSVGPPDEGPLPHLRGVYALFPTPIKDVQFLNDTELLVSDGQTLWMVNYDVRKVINMGHTSN